MFFYRHIFAMVAHELGAEADPSIWKIASPNEKEVRKYDIYACHILLLFTRANKKKLQRKNLEMEVFF